MKVYGGMKFIRGKQVRTIVAAKNQKEAAALVRESLCSFRMYWTATGNETEIAAAMSQPGIVLCASTSMGYDFKPYEEMRKQ